MSIKDLNTTACQTPNIHEKINNKFQIYTDIVITSKNGASLNQYFDAIKKNLPRNFKQKHNQPYADRDTFKILKKYLCIQLPKFRVKETKIEHQGLVWLGLTDDEIILLKIESVDPNKSVDFERAIGCIIYWLDKEIFSKIPEYTNYDHNYQYRGILDAHYNVSDLREKRSVIYNAKNEKLMYTIRPLELIKFSGIEIGFTSPNIIALYLDKFKQSYKKAREFYKSFSKTQFSRDLNSEQTKLLYDYYSEIQSCIIFSYTALEAFVNAAIPENYEYKTTNSKGVKESWPKDAIERWFSTSDKVDKILTQILDISNLKEQKCLEHFKQLEQIRGQLIHPKTDNNKQINSPDFELFLRNSIFDIAESALKVILFLYKHNPDNAFFPLGLGSANYKIIEIESASKTFELVK